MDKESHKTIIQKLKINQVVICILIPRIFFLDDILSQFLTCFKFSVYEGSAINIFLFCLIS